MLCDSLGSLDQSTPLGSGWLVAASESREKRHRWAPGAISQKNKVRRQRPDSGAMGGWGVVVVVGWLVVVVVVVVAVVGCWLLVLGSCVLVLGSWFFFVGCWLLAVGC